MKKVNAIEVANAVYLDGYRLRIAFTDGKEKEVDFSTFILGNQKQALAKYKNSAFFKKFRIEQGNIVWGKNWDLIFPVQELYKGVVSCN